MNYGEILRNRRLQKKMSQQALADAAQFGRRGRVYIASIEAGDVKIPGADKWTALCRVLEIDPANGAPLHEGAAGSTFHAAPSSQMGIRMVRTASGDWAPFLISEDPARYDDGTVLELRDSNGEVIKVEIATVRGVKWLLPLPDEGAR